MSRWTPCKRSDFIRRLRALGFDGPFSGGCHSFMLSQDRRLAIPSNSEMPLNEIRAARELTQEHLAKLLRVKQASVSELERRADIYVSTLRDSVRAMGGELEITARFPEGEVRIKQFDLGPASR